MTMQTTITRKGKEPVMAPVIGDTIVTTQSGVVGTVLEVVPTKVGSWRVRIAHDGGEKWTTVQP